MNGNGVRKHIIWLKFSLTPLLTVLIQQIHQLYTARRGDVRSVNLYTLNQSINKTQNTCLSCTNSESTSVFEGPLFGEGGIHSLIIQV